MCWRAVWELYSIIVSRKHCSPRFSVLYLIGWLVNLLLQALNCGFIIKTQTVWREEVTNDCMIIRITYEFPVRHDERSARIEEPLILDIYTTGKFFKKKSTKLLYHCFHIFWLCWVFMFISCQHGSMKGSRNGLLKVILLCGLRNQS